MVVLRVTHCGVCHSDVHIHDGHFDMGGGNKVSTQKTMNPPRTMGHEIVGEVVALGPDAKGAKVGDKAVVYPWIGCGTCWYCTNGREHLCPAPLDRQPVQSAAPVDTGPQPVLVQQRPPRPVLDLDHPEVAVEAPPKRSKNSSALTQRRSLSLARILSCGLPS